MCICFSFSITHCVLGLWSGVWSVLYCHIPFQWAFSALRLPWKAIIAYPCLQLFYSQLRVTREQSEHYIPSWAALVYGFICLVQHHFYLPVCFRGLTGQVIELKSPWPALSLETVIIASGTEQVASFSFSNSFKLGCLLVTKRDVKSTDICFDSAKNDVWTRTFPRDTYGGIDGGWLLRAQGAILLVNSFFSTPPAHFKYLRRFISTQLVPYTKNKISLMWTWIHTKNERKVWSFFRQLLLGMLTTFLEKYFWVKYFKDVTPILLTDSSPFLNSGIFTEAVVSNTYNQSLFYLFLKNHWDKLAFERYHQAFLFHLLTY